MSTRSDKPLMSNGSSTTTSSAVTTQQKSTGSSTSQDALVSAETEITDINDNSHIIMPAVNGVAVMPGASTSSNEGNLDSTVFTTAAESVPQQEERHIPVRPVSKSPPVIRIIIHKRTNVEHVLDVKDYEKTVEEVCIRLLRENFKELGPAAVQLFGLASFDSKRTPRAIWKNPRSTFEEVMKNQGNQNHEYFLRVRFVPYFENRLNKLQELGLDLLKYLFFQCSDDFVNDRFRKIFEKSLDESAKKRGYAVLHMLIEIKLEDKEPDYIRKCKKMGDFLPAGEIPKHFWNLLKKVKLQGNMNERLDEYWDKYRLSPVEEFMLGYICDVIQTVGLYGIEQYKARLVGMDAKGEHPVSLMINVHVDEAEKKGLYINEELFSRIEHFRSISIIPSQSHGVNVHLDRSEGHSQVLKFPSLEIAESFVSGLNGYYRLMSDFYMSLCQQVEPPSQKKLAALRCHGPMDTEDAVEKLKQRQSENQYYILKQHVKAFNSYAILFSHQAQIRRWAIQKDKGKYTLEKEEEEFSSLKKLVDHMVVIRGLLPENPICVRPRQEPCNNLRRLFFKEDFLIPDEDSEEKLVAVRSLKQPVVFHTSDVKIESLRATGSFTEVYKGYLPDGKVVAVKTLRKTKLEQMFMCYEPLQMSTERMMQIEEPKFFAGLYGVCLSTPIRVVMEYAEFGSLSTFFRERTPQQPISLNQLLWASTQVASGLLYLQENDMHHGGICCRNILLFKYRIGYIHVKIGDPGMVTLLNTLDIEYPENRRRIPWLAPELLDDLTQMTTMSDMYAFGTTIWEMFSFGHNPVDGILPSIEARKMKQRMQELKLPTPETLKNDKHEEVEDADNNIPKCKQKVVDAMRWCWNTEPQSRPGASEMLRDLNTIITSYGGDSYHFYNTIRDKDQELSIGSVGGRHSGLGSGSTDVPSIPMPFSDLGSGQVSAPAVEPIPTRLSNLNPSMERVVQPTPTLPNAAETVVQGRPMPSPSRQPVARRPAGPLPDPFAELSYLINPNKLLIDNIVLGRGHYGEVKKGTYYPNPNDKTKSMPIAAKILKGEFQNVLDSMEFKAEATIMMTLDHLNIVKFIGISNNMLILEYVAKGSLSSFLRFRKKSKKPLSCPQLVLMCKEVAEGMKYLTSMNIIHCDLAGRNVLVTKDHSVKISDFGLAKQLAKDKDYYTRSKEKDLPILWCAPEAIDYRRFTVKSDVWSYGVLMWEIFSHGRTPLFTGEKSRNQSKLLNDGKRLSHPSTERCPDEVYRFMQHCWEKDPADRPDFVQACEKLSEFCQTYPVERVNPRPAPLNLDGRRSQSQVSPPVQDYSVFGVGATKTEVPKVESRDDKPKDDQRPKEDGGVNPERMVDGGLRPERKPLPAVPAQPTGIPPQPTTAAAFTLAFLIPEQKLREFPDKRLGEGEFGYVIKGLLRTPNNSLVDVAIKKLIDKGVINDKIQDAFKEEVNNIGRAEHPNIVKFYGYMNQPNFAIVMEFVENGSLKNYLDKEKECGRRIRDPRLLQICTDVATGMAYLSSIHMVHSDLAARNILLTKDYHAKITDFGLSKTLMKDKDYYTRRRQCKIPAYYMAPEFFDKQKLSIKGDVWGYGVMMWECFSMGEIPNLFGKEEELGKVAYYTLQKGVRLPKPDNCPDTIYDLMMKCWKWEPEKRPGFDQIHIRCLQLQEEIGLDNS